MIEEQKGAAEAESLLEDIGFDTLPIVPSKVVDEIDSSDFRVVMETQKLNSDKILGKAEGNRKGALIYINSNIPDPGRFNFTAAHEIGHVCMHIMSERETSFECGSKELYDQFNSPIEKEENGFASGLLLPRYLISKLTNGETNWKNIERISNSCGSSLEATYRRMNVLNNSPSAMVIHKNGKFRRFITSRNFDFFIENSPLSYEQKALCVDVKNENYPDDFETVDASDWVNPICRDITLDVIYSSSIILNDGFTYSIISYDEECFADESF